LTRRDFSHRKALVERCILALGNFFSVGVYAYAVISNHVHVVLTVQPDQANQWAAGEVVARWLRVFPSRKEKRMRERRAAMLADPARVAECRERLSNLSSFMRCLNEYLAKRFNLEDECTGRFWEGRFSCQALLNQKALLASMAYVDLNPIRTEIAKRIAASSHAGACARH